MQLLNCCCDSMDLWLSAAEIVAADCGPKTNGQTAAFRTQGPLSVGHGWATGGPWVLLVKCSDHWSKTDVWPKWHQSARNSAPDLAMSQKKKSNKINYLVRLAGIEPTTLGFGGQYSIH